VKEKKTLKRKKSLHLNLHHLGVEVIPEKETKNIKRKGLEAKKKKLLQRTEMILITIEVHLLKTGEVNQDLRAEVEAEVEAEVGAGVDLLKEEEEAIVDVVISLEVVRNFL